MPDDAKSERTIFIEALDRPAGQPRQAYVDEACAGNADLGDRVQSLLDAHKSPQVVLERFGFDAAEQPSRDAPSGSAEDTMVSEVGSQIGPYKVLGPIGEGGFGMVYRAEQQRPVRRRVALKVIKLGMDTNEVIARFEAERQALALMDHPNIARVLDAGTTETGRPYFVMELVEGISLTDHCDENRLTTSQRLRLFVAVCQAVQHAHQKAIIHRDLKPSNVLVTVQDGAAVPKVIDFGVAKALDQRLTERTLFTEIGQFIGTPAYMSPEQADPGSQDIDTRSDIYSLGVLLYELLTGTTPFDADTLRDAGYEEVCRMIREEEPPRPSARLSSLCAERRSTVSAQRRTEARKLTQSVRGELDWIVMKALEKDLSWRYEAASEIAADVERYLNDEPIAARAPSVTCRLQKFARRNKGTLTTLALVGAAVLVGCCSLILLWKLNHERQRSETVLSEVEDSRKTFDEAMYREVLASDALIDLGRTYKSDNRLDEAEAVLELALRIKRNLAAYAPDIMDAGKRMDILHGLEFACLQLARVQYQAVKLESAEKNFGEAAHRAEALVAEYPHRQDFKKELTDARFALAKILLFNGDRSRVAGRLREAEEHLREALRLLGEVIGRDVEGGKGIRSHFINACFRLGLCRFAQARDLLLDAHDAEQAKKGFCEARELFQAFLADNPMHHGCRLRLFDVESNLTALFETSGELRNAAREFLHAARLKEALASDFPETQIYGHWRGMAKSACRLSWRLIQDSDDPTTYDPFLAVSVARVTLKYRRDVGSYWATLGIALHRANQWPEALAALQDASTKTLDATERCRVQLCLAMAYCRLGRESEARPHYDEGSQWTSKHPLDDEDLHALRAEAAMLLGISHPVAQSNPSGEAARDQ